MKSTITLGFFFIISCSINNKVVKKDPDSKLKDLTLTDSTNSSYKSEFYKGLKNWKVLKQTNGNSYIYSTEFYSMESGYNWITKITVKKGKVVVREYKSYLQDMNNGKRKEIKKEWYTEKLSEVGKNKLGAPAITIDSLYKSCIGKYLKVDSKHNTIFFEKSKNGLITTCGYSPKNCADDCFEGISINSFKWIQ